MAEEILFSDVAPVVPVLDLDAALDQYRRLGFAVKRSDGGERYGFATRGAVSLHLSEWPGHDAAHSDTVVYLYVSDADAVYDEWVKSGVEGCFGEPADRPYGMHEFAFVDPNGTLHRVGSRSSSL